PEMGSSIQGTIRINTYVGLIVANSLGGTQGMGLFSIAAAIVVPLVNIISVVGFTLYGHNQGQLRPARMLLQILRNPMVLGCLIGFSNSLAPIEWPTFVAAALELLGNAAIVSDTLSGGAALHWDFSQYKYAVIAVVSSLTLIL